MEWYVRIGDKQLGPMSDEALHAMAGTGQIKRDTLVWRAGLKEWIRADLAPGVLLPPTALPSQPVSHPPADPRGEPPASSPVSGSDPVPNPWGRSLPSTLAGPWKRYFARYLDILVWSVPIGVLVGLVWPSLLAEGGAFAGPGQEVILGWLILPVVMVIDAFAYSIFGNTPGKWLAGIRVMGLKGGPVSFSGYLHRNFQMYLNGLGTGFPLVSLFTLASSHKRATNHKIMSWDQALETRNFDLANSRTRTWLVAILVFVIYSVLRTIK